MTKFFFKLEKPYFWLISEFWGHKKFSQKIRLSYTTSQGFLATSWNLKKANNPVPRKHQDRQQDGRTDRPYFIGPFQLQSNKYNCSRLTFKSQSLDYNVGLIKNYCITVSMQKISSIHKLILKIQQILGSHELQ